MDRPLLRAYAGAVTALAVTGTWLAVSADVLPADPAPAPAPVAAVAAPPPLDAAAQARARGDLRLAAEYRRLAASVSDTAAARAAAAPVVTVTRAAPVVATRSS